MIKNNLLVPTMDCTGVKLGPELVGEELDPFVQELEIVHAEQADFVAKLLPGSGAPFQSLLEGVRENCIAKNILIFIWII
jgi:hypothetical protein